MRCAHAKEAWAAQARELDSADAAWLEEHHLSCAECGEAMASAAQARALLEQAVATAPTVDWAKVDEGLEGRVERLLAPSPVRTFRLPPRWVLAPLAVACAVAFAVWLWPAAEAPVAPVAAAPLPELPARLVAGAQVKGTHGALLPGATVAVGEQLETGKRGRAFLTLPDASALRLDPRSKLVVRAAGQGRIELGLVRGQVAVEASHRAREAFVVHAADVTVHVVGTRFGVSTDGAVTRVEVAEGQVRVEAPGGSVLRVAAGEAVEVSKKGTRVDRKGLSVAQAQALVVSPPPMVVATTPAAGGKAPAPAEQAATQQRLARVLRQEAEDEQLAKAIDPAPAAAAKPKPAQADAWSQWAVETAAAEQQQPPAPQPAPAPPAQPQVQQGPQAWETQAQGTPLSPEDEWAPLPANAQPVQPVQVVPPPSAMPGAPTYAQGPNGLTQVETIPVDVEGIFVRRAERALSKGRCERYLLGLSELAVDVQQRPELASRSRILRARCFDSKLRPDLAEPEYRRYLSDFPMGPFSAEAQAALAE